MERRLSAILAADMVGYSRLIEADEVGTLRRQKIHRTELIDPLLERFHGRIVKEMGDGILVEFPSVVEAAQCALIIQRDMVDRESHIESERRIQYRIGINIGDIVIDGDDIFGNGVNIAARLEQIAEPGGICISGMVYDQLKSKDRAGYESIGDVKVKNISQTIRVYKFLITSEEAREASGNGPKKPENRFRWLAITLIMSALLLAGGSWWWWQSETKPGEADKSAYNLHGRPSIAVLPFDNLSGRTEEKYFADGMAEDIITDLSKLKKLFVISRNSSFRYRGDDVDIKKVGQELGVQYVLEGSVRRSGDKLRINAQLIEAASGGHIWAERYDGELENVFSLQDTLTANIVKALNINLAPEEKAQISDRGTSSIAAYDAYLKGREFQVLRTSKDTAKAVEYYKLALEIDPDYSNAAAALASSYLSVVNGFWGSTHGLPTFFDAKAEAEKYANLALKLNANSAAGHTVSSQILYLRPNPPLADAVRGAQLAIRLEPNNAEAHFGLGFIYVYGGKPDLAIKYLQAALRLDPANIAEIENEIAVAYFGKEEYGTALKHAKAAIAASPTNSVYSLIEAAAYAQLDQMDKAKAAIRDLNRKRRGEFRRKFNSYDLSFWIVERHFMKNEDRERYKNALLKAGIMD